MVDLGKLNKNGSHHKYSLSDYRTFLWQPAWQDVELQKQPDEDEDQLPLDLEKMSTFGKVDPKTGKPPNL